MPQGNVIATEFDGTIPEDVILEESDNKEEMTNILGNSENIRKAYEYLSEMYKIDKAIMNKVLKFDTIEDTNFTAISLLADTNLILIKNIRDSESFINYNGGQFVLLPFESFEFPVTPATDTLQVKGKVTTAEIQYIL